MDLNTLAQLGQFVGGIVVVVSLIYLALQVRQNTKMLKTESYGRALDRMAAIQSKLSTDEELNRILVLGSQTPEALDPSERMRLNWALYELLGAAEFMYHQVEEDALSSEVWTRWRETIVWWFSNPGVRAWWEAKPVPMSSDFEAFVEDLIGDRAFDDETARRWERFVMGDNSPEEEGENGPSVNLFSPSGTSEMP